MQSRNLTRWLMDSRIVKRGFFFRACIGFPDLCHEIFERVRQAPQYYQQNKRTCAPSRPCPDRRRYQFPGRPRKHRRPVPRPIDTLQQKREANNNKILSGTKRNGDIQPNTWLPDQKFCEHNRQSRIVRFDVP